MVRFLILVLLLSAGPFGPAAGQDAGPQGTAAVDLVVALDAEPATALPRDVFTLVARVENRGPSDVDTGIVLTHALPGEILDPVWTCVPEGGANCGSGTGPITDPALSLPNGGSVTYTLEGVVADSATGTLNHFFSAFPPSSHSEDDDTDNTAQDTTQVGALVDLVVALDAEPATALPGDAFTLVARVENRGPSDVGTGIVLTHALPGEILDPVWTCVPEGGANCGSGTGPITDPALSLPNGGSVTYTLEGVVADSATGTLNHFFSAFPPSSHSEDDDTDNVAQDTTQVDALVDLVVALDAEPATALPGDAFTLVARVENRGPSGVGTGIDLTHALPDEILDPVWTCVPEAGASCGSSGIGAIVDDALSLPNGGSVTYTLEGVVAASANGTLNHSFSAFPPSSHSEDDDTDNTAQDTTQVSAAPVPRTVPALGAFGMAFLGIAAGLVALRRFHAGK